MRLFTNATQLRYYIRTSRPFGTHERSLEHETLPAWMHGACPFFCDRNDLLRSRLWGEPSPKAQARNGRTVQRRTKEKPALKRELRPILLGERRKKTISDRCHH